MHPPTLADDVGRRALATWAVLIWLLGFEVLPNLHVGMHGSLGAHQHARAHDDHAAHTHAHAHDGSAAHHHIRVEPIARALEAAAKPRETAPQRLLGRSVHAGADDARAVAIASRLDPEHGRHDLLHRGIAVTQPPIAMPAIHEARVVLLARTPAVNEPVRSRAPLQARARGPPAATSCRSVDCTSAELPRRS